MKPIFLFCDKFCVLIVQILSTTFTFYFNIVIEFDVFHLSPVVYCVNHFQMKKQLKSKNKIHNPNDPIKTPIKFNHARIIHLSWSFVVFRNVFFSGNQTIFFIFLAVYEIKIILQVLRTFSMHLFLFWMYILNKAKQILHRPTLKPYKFNCLKSNWFEIMFHWFRLFPFFAVYKVKFAIHVSFCCLDYNIIFYNFKSILIFLFDKFNSWYMFISWMIRIPNFAWIRNGKSFFKTNFGLIVTGTSTRIIQPHIVCFVRHKLTKSFRPRPWNWIRVEIRFTDERQHNVNISWRSLISQIRPSVFVWIIIFSNNQNFIFKRVWINKFRNITFTAFKRWRQK